MDLLQPYSSEEKFQDSQGNYCCSRFDVTQFVGVRSVLDVFNAAVLSFDHEEISLSERLGHITVRDDYDVEGDNFANCRMLSEDENGVKTEMNIVAFGEFVDASVAPDGQSYAILVRDTVDVDDLYPYNPSEYVRKDHMAVMVLTLAKRKKEGLAAPGDEDELVVTVRSAVHTKIHRPAFPMPDRTQQGLRRDLTSWLDAMVASMRSTLSMSVT
ncbi:hypothetical protein BBJ28_00013732 [Nothophytophthora sp. Chile5]|nr:hypothetical protein BBJ28_00013732 [Nothophytophthora sp. Chile5]